MINHFHGPIEFLVFFLSYQICTFMLFLLLLIRIKFLSNTFMLMVLLVLTTHIWPGWKFLDWFFLSNLSFLYLFLLIKMLHLCSWFYSHLARLELPPELDQFAGTSLGSLAHRERLLKINIILHYFLNNSNFLASLCYNHDNCSKIGLWVR